MYQLMTQAASRTNIGFGAFSRSTAIVWHGQVPTIRFRGAAAERYSAGLRAGNSLKWMNWNAYSDSERYLIWGIAYTSWSAHSTLWRWMNNIMAVNRLPAEMICDCGVDSLVATI
jgi:hypothetical protein